MPKSEANNALDRERFEFEREKWKADQAAHREELDLKREEASRSRWINPLVIAVFAAAAAGLGNVGVTLISSYQQLHLEKERATLTQSNNMEQSRSTLRLEQSKSEAARILEVVKTNDPDKAAVNLRFLLDAGLINDPDTRKHIQVYLDKRQPGQGFTLPSAVQPPGPDDRFDFKVCNGSSVKASIAVVGKRMPSMQSFNDEGWWTIPAGDCAGLGKFSKSSRLYWTASSTEQGGQTWGQRQHDRKNIS